MRVERAGEIEREGRERLNFSVRVSTKGYECERGGGGGGEREVRLRELSENSRRRRRRERNWYQLEFFPAF